MVKIISNVKGDHVEASVELAGNMKAIVSELVMQSAVRICRLVHRTSAPHRRSARCSLSS